MNTELLTNRERTIAINYEALIFHVDSARCAPRDPRMELDSPNAFLQVSLQSLFLAERRSTAVASELDVVVDVEMLLQTCRLREAFFAE